MDPDGMVIGRHQAGAMSSVAAGGFRSWLSCVDRPPGEATIGLCAASSSPDTTPAPAVRSVLAPAVRLLCISGGRHV